MNLHEQPAKPISFSAAMVEAIQSGRKNQTRRIITPLPTYIESSGRWRWPLPKKALHPGCCTEVVSASREWHEYLPDGCSPYGRPGDLLWVREEHRIWGTRASGELAKIHCEYKDGTIHSKWVTDMPLNTAQRIAARKTLGLWQRARFLPRYFARTYLKVTDIQVERLQDITEEGAISEGIQPLLASRAQLAIYGQLYRDYSKQAELFNDGVRPIESFRTLWEKINGPGSWEASPWVWVVSFEKI